MLDPLTKERALVIAAQLAADLDVPMFVVRIGGSYAVASENDLDTWWSRALVTHEVMPDGHLTASD